MKNKIVCVLLAVSALVLTGCSHVPFFGKKNAAAMNVPFPPPAVTVAPMGNAAGPNFDQMSNTVYSSRRPQWVPVSVFKNMLNSRPRSYRDFATVVVTNKRVNERIAIQVGDQLLGIPDALGNLGVVIIPPGESFVIRDIWNLEETLLKAIVINDRDERVGYLAMRVGWPDPGYSGKEAFWDITSGPPDRMVSLPPGPSQSASMAPTLTPVP